MWRPNVQDMVSVRMYKINLNIELAIHVNIRLRNARRVGSTLSAPPLSTGTETSSTFILACGISFRSPLRAAASHPVTCVTTGSHLVNLMSVQHICVLRLFAYAVSTTVSDLSASSSPAVAFPSVIPTLPRLDILATTCFSRRIGRSCGGVL